MRNPGWRRAGLVFRIAVAAVACSWTGRAAEVGEASASAPLRLAFSTGVIGEINHNDAKASIIAWGRAVLTQRNMSTNRIVPSLFEQPAELYKLMQAGELDGAAVMMDEFLARPATVAPDVVYLSLRNGKATEQYLLLVHHAAGIVDLRDLKDRTLELHQSARTCLAGAWLDLCLAGGGLGRAETLFKTITPAEKASRAVMKVFFRQADAVIVTRDAFATMCELNPQLGKELRVLATSPEVIPTVFFLRPDLSASLRQELETAILTVHETVAGRQALTVFQGERLVQRPLADLQGSIELLIAAARVEHTEPRPNAGNAPPVSSLVEK